MESIEKQVNDFFNALPNENQKRHQIVNFVFHTILTNVINSDLDDDTKKKFKEIIYKSSDNVDKEYN